MMSSSPDDEDWRQCFALPYVRGRLFLFEEFPHKNKALNSSNAKNREEGNSSIQDVAADRADRIPILCGFEQCQKKKQIGMKDPSSRPSR
jgi:hypothetical protein